MINAPTITATLIMLVGVADDLRSRKFHNELFIGCCIVAFSVMAYTGGAQGLLLSVYGFLCGLGIFLPLVLMHMVGAGDMKLLAAFGIAAGWDAVIAVAIMGLMWGVVFGVVRILIDRQGRILIKNLVSIVTLKKRDELQLHKIPFTVALMMGWMSFLFLQRMQ